MAHPSRRTARDALALIKRAAEIQGRSAHRLRLMAHRSISYDFV
jgi:alkanesulfonate monooxygenase SsuD/methylene tetrahydromethanopterin reductase-like flavin-dependent oxidoreductase (luciferase family)